MTAMLFTSLVINFLFNKPTITRKVNHSFHYYNTYDNVANKAGKYGYANIHTYSSTILVYPMISHFHNLIITDECLF